MPDALELLKIRRSIKPREMTAPGPSPAELETILTIGARVPDHGKLFDSDGIPPRGAHRVCRRARLQATLDETANGLRTIDGMHAGPCIDISGELRGQPDRTDWILLDRASGGHKVAGRRVLIGFFRFRHGRAPKKLNLKKRCRFFQRRSLTGIKDTP